MLLQYRVECKTWAIFFATILISFFVHELGHCVVAWFHGLKAIPTPAKEYLIAGNIPAGVNEGISLGGPTGTALFSVMAIIFFKTTKLKYRSSFLAGGLATPGMYCLGFLLIGRGHDETEFQEAQSALGLPYAGHVLDWFFLTLFLVGVVAWVISVKPSYRIMPRLIIGFVVALFFAAGLQKINNTIFDPILLPHAVLAK